MNSVLENLRGEGKLLRDLLEELRRHSSISRWHDPNTSEFIYMGGHFGWNPLNDEGRWAQGRTLEEYRRFHAIMRALLREQPQESLGKLEESDGQILELVQQQGSLYSADPNIHFRRGIEALESQLTLLDRLYGAANGTANFVPDTNALIFNSDLASWRFDGVAQFVIVLTPPVLSELDNLKVNHRVEAVRQKAESVVRQIKEYRRRASAAGSKLTEGITLVTSVSEIVAIATEPKMELSLPWLDPGNTDDRLLAAFIEVMRLRPRSAVILVTRDINLQNKAEFAKLPFVEPPDPP